MRRLNGGAGVGPRPVLRAQESGSLVPVPYYEGRFARSQLRSDEGRRKPPGSRDESLRFGPDEPVPGWKTHSGAPGGARARKQPRAFAGCPGYRAFGAPPHVVREGNDGGPTPTNNGTMNHVCCLTSESGMQAARAQPAMTGCVMLRHKHSSNTGEKPWPEATRTRSPIIQGGSKGIGQAFAKRLAEDGVHVAIGRCRAGRRDREG